MKVQFPIHQKLHFNSAHKAKPSGAWLRGECVAMGERYMDIYQLPHDALLARYEELNGQRQELISLGEQAEAPAEILQIMKIEELREKLGKHMETLIPIAQPAAMQQALQAHWHDNYNPRASVGMPRRLDKEGAERSRNALEVLAEFCTLCPKWAEAKAA